MGLSNILIEDEPLWLVTSEGSWVAGGKFVKGYAEPVEFTGDWEPFNASQSSFVTPSGVSSKEIITLFTDKDIKISNDLQDNLATPSLVYLANPTLVSDTKPYVVWNKASFIQNGGFSLINGYFEYILIRQEKLETP